MQKQISIRNTFFQKQDFVDCKNELKYDLMFPVNYVGYSIKTVPYLHVDSPRLVLTPM